MLAEDLEREVLEIRLIFGIVELATSKIFCIEDTRIHVLILSKNMKRKARIMGVHDDLVLCSIADQTIGVREGVVQFSCSFAMITPTQPLTKKDTVSESAMKHLKQGPSVNW